MPHEAARFCKGGDWHGSGGVANFVTRGDLSIAADHAHRAVRRRRAHRRAGAHPRRADAKDARADRRHRKRRWRIWHAGGHQSGARGAGRLHHHHRSLGNACSQRCRLFAAVRRPERLRADRLDRERPATHHRQTDAAGAEVERTDRLAEGQPEQGDRRDRRTGDRLPCCWCFLPKPDRDQLFLCALSRRRPCAERPDGRAYRSDVRSGHKFVAASARRQCESLCRDFALAARICARHPDGR